MDVVVKEEDDNEPTIMLEHFPFICRICLLRSDLRLVHPEKCLIDLFHAITKIEVRSVVEFPKNICARCISKLEEISVFIDISKINDSCLVKHSSPKKEIEHPEATESETTMESEGITEQPNENTYFRESPFCRICLYPNNLTSCEKKSHLMQLFHSLTGINVDARINSVKNENWICNLCINKLEEILAFISLSLSNDKKLGDIIGINTAVKIESYSNQIESEFLKLEPVFDEDNEKSNNDAEDEKIDLKERIIDSKPMQREYSCLHVHTKEKRNLQRSLLINTVEKLFHCNYCEKSFQHKDSLPKHMRIHTGTKPFKCDCCDKSFSYSSSLKSHKQSHTREKPFKCDYCDRKFKRSQELKVHLRTHSGEKPFECYLCGKSFTHNLKRHLLCHTKKPYKCDYCARSFIDSSLLENHMHTHTGEKLFHCHLCDKRFSRKDGLQLHLRIHTGEKPFKCDCCDKIFSDPSALRSHKRVHTEGKPFKCDRCDKSFKRLPELKVHLRTHTGEKPYKCNCCSKTFVGNTALTNHMRTHTGEKPFHCHYCGKLFSQKSVLQKHLRIHTGEKPYKCDGCEESFSNPSQLKAHKRTHTEEKPFRCD